jgi:hypothetical protein
MSFPFSLAIRRQTAPKAIHLPICAWNKEDPRRINILNWENRMSEYLDQLVKALETEARDAQGALRTTSSIFRKPDPAAGHLRRLRQRLKALKELQARHFRGECRYLHTAMRNAGRPDKEVR